MASLLSQIAVFIYSVNLACGGILKNDEDYYGDLEEPNDREIDEIFDLCPKENSEIPTYLAHPSECNKFYICDSGTPHLKECQPGLHFSSKIKTCDYPENAECDSGHEIQIDSKIVNDDSTSACPVKKTKSRPDFIPHHTNCSNFFICNGGTKFPFTCPSGLHFNPRKEACDFPENAQCDTNILKKPKGKSLEENDSFSCPERNSPDQSILFPHPVECDKFYLCDQGKPVLKNCPPGLNFNEKLQVCDYKENTICLKHMEKSMAGNPSPFCPSRNGKIPIFFRHPSNCSIFYLCGNGLAYEFVCPAKLHFNVRKRICDYESNANCRIANL